MRARPAAARNAPFAADMKTKRRPRSSRSAPTAANPNSSGWSVRVVPNKFPALRIEGELGRRGDGIFDMMNGVGAHEVIIETPDHSVDLAQLSEAQIEEVLWSYHDRVYDLTKDRRFRYILIFKNHGAEAGASLEHTHSQLIALPIIPLNVVEELHGAREYFRHKERCVFCDLIRQELRQGTPGRGERRVCDRVSRSRPGSRWRRGSCRSATAGRSSMVTKHEYHNLARALRDCWGA